MRTKTIILKIQVKLLNRNERPEEKTLATNLGFTDSCVDASS